MSLDIVGEVPEKKNVVCEKCGCTVDFFKSWEGKPIVKERRFPFPFDKDRFSLHVPYYCGTCRPDGPEDKQEAAIAKLQKAITLLDKRIDNLENRKGKKCTAKTRSTK